MRCNLQPLPLSRIRYLRQPPPQLSQTRCRPSFRPHRLSRMRPHRAPRQELCSEGQISQTDEVSHKLPQGRPRRRSKCPGLWVGSHLAAAVFDESQAMPYESHLVEVIISRGMSRSGEALIRATLIRAIVLLAAFAGSFAPVQCLGQYDYELSYKATKELSPQLLSLLQQKNMPKYSPIVVRIFKEELELEVWKQDTTGRFQLLKIYPICRWSGDLGPKLDAGDRQAPEGFYTVTMELMNSRSNYYLAINTGFPNELDKANDRDGAFLMIHGDCSSVAAMP